MGTFTSQILRTYPRVFGRKRYVKLNHFLINLGLRGIGILNFDNVKGGEEYLMSYLKNNHTIRMIFDVGAHEGGYAQMVSPLGAVINCFEPNPKTFEVLSRRFQKNPNIHVHSLGLSEEDGTATIYDRGNEEGSQHASIYESVITDIHRQEVVSSDIRLMSLDHFVADHGITHIDLLKIDTEGHELSVLKGATDCLANNLIDIIQFEFNEMNVISGVFLRDFVKLLRGFNLYRLLPHGFLPIHYFNGRPVMNEFFAYQNFVAFRKDIDKVKT